jgi:hypothetical protein
MATTTGRMSVARGIEDPSVVVRLVEDALHPRWVLWSNDTAATLVLAGVRIATCWDLAGVHRLLFGGWRADPACVWCRAPVFRSRSSERQMQAGFGKIAPDCLGRWRVTSSDCAVVIRSSN